jgi:aromatic-L-amino-acid decarboxylase
MDAEEFRRLGHRLVDWIAEHRARVESLPVMSRARPGELRARFPAQAPERGGGAGEALDALDEVVVPGITHWTHPGFFAYFPGNTSLASVLGDLLAAGLGAQGMSWQTSPAATELEEVVMGWIRGLVGLSPAWQGVIQDTASTATLTALLCARERTTRMSHRAGGLQAAGVPLVVYASEQAHSSVEKAVRLAGLGADHLRLVETDAAHALVPEALERAVREDAARGMAPCAVVATVGTTGTTAVDPVAAAARIAREHGLWLHVDAALAGTAMVLPECRGHWEGVEEADSLVLNPHKWMGIGFDFSAYYVRDPAFLQAVMSTSPSYLKTAQDAEVRNLRDWGIPLGRRFRALKAWLHLVDEGAEGLRARVRRDLANARWLAAQVDAAAGEGWERLAPVPFQTVCLRHVPGGERDAARLAAHNLELAARVNASGRAYLTPAVVKGVQLVRVSLGSLATERRHVEEVWRLLRDAAR